MVFEYAPVIKDNPALYPTAVFWLESVIEDNAWCPIAVL